MRRAAAAAVVVFALAACSSGSHASVRASDRAAWSSYRAAVAPDLDRVFGITNGLVADCRQMLLRAPAPRFGVDVRPTLRRCALGDLSNARMLAHIQVDRIATDDRALGRIP